MHVCTRQQLVLFQEELKIDYLPKMMNKHLIMLIIIFLLLHCSTDHGVNEGGIFLRFRFS